MDKIMQVGKKHATMLSLFETDMKEDTRNNYEPVRYNAMKHGILSNLAVLPHENSEEFADLVAALLEEHHPQGMTERHLVEELASIIWRKRRVLLAEGSTINQSLRISVKNTESVVSSAVPFKGGLTGTHIDLRDMVATTQAENVENLQYADLDLRATQQASQILYQGGVKAYEKARLALHKDSRGLWDEKVKEGSSVANVEALKTWVDEWLLPYCYNSQLETQYQPAIKAQTLGEGLQAHRLENVTRYETHLDRKFERTLAMILKMNELHGMNKP